VVFSIFQLVISFGRSAVLIVGAKIDETKQISIGSEELSLSCGDLSIVNVFEILTVVDRYAQIAKTRATGPEIVLERKGVSSMVTTVSLEATQRQWEKAAVTVIAETKNVDAGHSIANRKSRWVGLIFPQVGLKRDNGNPHALHTQTK
jgi:hypothetical protein